MSSMLNKFLVVSVLIPAIFCSPTAQAQQASEWQAGIGASSPPVSSPGIQPILASPPRLPSPAMLDASAGNIPAAMQRWRMLRAGGNFSFGEYAGFLLSYPGWPDEKDMRRNAELMLDPNSYSPSQAVAFFDRYPPTTNAGRAKYAVALSAMGLTDKAMDWGRKAWRSGPLTADMESRLLNLFGRQLRIDDHDARVDALIWAGATNDAMRQLAYASPERRATFEARLAFRAGRDGGPGGPTAVADAGYLADRALFLRKSGNTGGMLELLANYPRLLHRPADAEKWLQLLLTSARSADSSRQYRLAWQIASRVGDTLPPEVDVSDESLRVRDDYTSIAWLGGRTALEKLGQPAEAMRLFELYARAAKTPQTITKGLYWAAKAARLAGDNARATAYLEEAAVSYDYFYGQLAMEALGRPMPRPVADPRLLADLGKPSSSPLYMAASYLAQNGSRQDQSLFLRAIANGAKTEREHLSAIALSKYIGRPDLSVMAGRNGRVEGHAATIPWAFPTVSVPPGFERNFTLIHAISRQESQFDRAAVSHAGARGMMQLMPGTARETARYIDLVYVPESLTIDTHYNIKLGSTYIDRMLRYYNYSYPLAIAAYNAGPGNVNKWLAANGDPRTGAVDIITWIENIPIYETKNYVHRVLENAVMYDLLNPDKALIRSATPLSTYLGKRNPG